MKISRLFSKKVKLRAATSAKTAPRDFADEPDIKLSSAVIVVVVLHLVAVGGIIGFNSIKAHQPPAADETVNKPVKTKAESDADDDAKPAVTMAANVSAMKIYHVKSGDTLTKIAAANGVSLEDLEAANNLKNVAGLRVGQEIKIPAKPAGKPVSGGSHKAADAKTASASLKDSGETCTVAKGDTLAVIAKKFHVNREDLLKLNKIEDPKKLQIGQKLRLPAKHKNDVASAQ